MARCLLRAVLAASAAGWLAPARAQGPLARPGLRSPERRLEGGGDVPPVPAGGDGSLAELEWSAEESDDPVSAAAEEVEAGIIWKEEEVEGGAEGAHGAESAAHGAEEHGDAEGDAEEGHADAEEGHADAEEGHVEAAVAAVEEGHADAEGHAEGHAEVGDAEGHLGHAEVGHAEEGHHEPVDPARAAVSRALGYCLMGSVAWIMMVYYQVNSKDADVVKATWQILNDMLSIFVAVLIFACTKHVSVAYFGEEDGHSHAPPDLKTSLIAVLRLALFFAVVHGLIYFASKREHALWSMKSVGIVGGHVIGFAAIDVFGGMLEQPFSHSFFCVITVAVSIVVFSGLLYIVSHKLLTKLGSDEEYHEVARECQHDAACLCYGLLVSMCVRYAITGHMPPIHGAPKDKSSLQVILLFTVTVVFGVLVVVIGNVVAAKKQSLSQLAEHAMELVQLTSSMTMGWCMLFFGQWWFWNGTGGQGAGTGSKMSARMLMAMIFSLVCFAAIRIVDCFADNASRSTEKGLRQLLSTFGIVMGLTWEACFTQAIEGISSDFEETQAVLAEFVLTVTLSVVVLPAWALYILPKVMTEDGDEKKKEPSSMESDDETE